MSVWLCFRPSNSDLLVCSYDGYITWRADIATVLVVGRFEYRPHIGPACVEFFEFLSQKYPGPGARALVAGWGYTKVSFLT